MTEFYLSIDTCVLGRKTHVLSVKFGKADADAGKKNYTFSRTLSNAASPKVTFIDEDVRTFAERIAFRNGQAHLAGGRR